MAVTLSIDTNMLGADVAEFNKALASLHGALGKAAMTAPKVAGYYVCDSLRARTRPAPKRARPKEWEATPFKWTGGFRTIEKNGRKFVIPTPSPYVTNPRRGHGKSSGSVLHRWNFTHHKGMSSEKKFPVYAYAALKHNAKDRIVKDLAHEKAEIRQYHTAIAYHGLAKNSWKWAKKDIYGRGGDDFVARRRKNDRRNPRTDVHGSFTQTRDSGTVRIVNKLDYIRDALYPGAVEESVRAAKEKIIWNVDDIYMKASQRFPLGSPELMNLPTFLDERLMKK